MSFITLQLFIGNYSDNTMKIPLLLVHDQCMNELRADTHTYVKRH